MTGPRVAACLSGLMREYKSCRASQEQYLRLLFPCAQLTYFIATWDRTEANSHSVKQRYGKPGEAQIYDMDAVRRFYKPAAMTFESYTKETAIRLQQETGYTSDFRRSLSRFPAPQVKPKECVGMCPECGNCSYNERYEYCCLCGGYLTSTNALSQLYKVAQADKLRQQWEKDTGEAFDYVVRLRSDILVEPLVDLSIVSRLTDAAIAVPKFGGDFTKNPRSPNDIFFFGKPGPMTKVCQAYYKARDIVLERLRTQGVGDLAHYWVGHNESVHLSWEMILADIFTKRDYKQKDENGISKWQYLESLQGMKVR